MAEVSISDALRADRRVVDALITKTRGSIPGTLNAGELRALGYEVPDGYVLRAWPFEYRQGREGFLHWAQTGQGGPQPVLFNNRLEKADWIIFAAAGSVIGLGVLGFAGVGPLAGSSAAGAGSAGAAAAAAGGSTAATASAAATIVSTVAAATPTAAAIVNALRGGSVVAPPTVAAPVSSGVLPSLTTNDWLLVGLVVAVFVFKR